MSIPSVLPQCPRSRAIPPPGFTLSFEPAKFNPYYFARTQPARLSSWVARLGTMYLYLDMEGDDPPTMQEAWAALEADIAVSEGHGDLPDVVDRRMALEAIHRRAHTVQQLWPVICTTQWAQTKAARVVQLETETKAQAAAQAAPKKASRAKAVENVAAVLDEFVIPATTVPTAPLNPTPAKVVTAATDLEEGRYKIPFDAIDVTKAELALLKDPATGTSVIERLSTYAIADLTREAKEKKRAETFKNIDKTLEEIAAFKLKQEVEEETRRRLSAESSNEWANL